MSGIDREQLRAATRGREPQRQGKRHGGAAPTQPTRVSDALPPVEVGTVTLGGRVFRLEPLTFNDLVSVEERYGELQTFLERVGQLRTSALRDFFWLILRKGDPSLCEEDRRLCRYRLTVEEVGALIPVQEGALLGILQRILDASGLMEKNAPTPAEVDR